MHRRQFSILFASFMFNGAQVSADSGSILFENKLMTLSKSKKYVKNIWRSPPNCYFTYPHCNGFTSKPSNPVLGQIDYNSKTVNYIEWDFLSGNIRQIFRSGIADMYWDICKDTGEFLLVQNRKRVVSVNTKGTPKVNKILDLYAESGSKFQGMLSVCPSGDKMLFCREYFIGTTDKISSTSLMQYDRNSKIFSEICKVPFAADHQHYCPADSSWIAFSHEGDISKTLDRMWCLNSGVNNGIPFRAWNEEAPENGGQLIVGHERWAFHKPGALIVAYPSSTGRPRGLYFLDASNLSVKLISPSNYDSHCNISQSGRWAVVDTDWSVQPNFEDKVNKKSEIVLVCMKDGRRYHLATCYAKDHPWHPHPHFTPDEKYIIYNDYRSEELDGQPCTVVIEINYPEGQEL